MKRFKNILCVIELGKKSNPALDRAVILAENSQANLTVITIAPSISAAIGAPEGNVSTDELQATSLNSYAQELETVVEPYHQRIKIETKVLLGPTFLKITREVIQNAYDLVIKCPESMDWLDRFFSSDDMHLLRKCPCPIWMVKPQSKEPYNRILVAVDVDDSYPAKELKTHQALNDTLMHLAGSLALTEQAELHVAHAWQLEGESALRNAAFVQLPEDKLNAQLVQVHQHHAKILNALIKDVGAKLGQDTLNNINPQVHMLKGPARQEIPKLAKKLNVDCIVMGTVARTGIPGFFIGNTAENILAQIECSVLAIKPPGFVTPVTLDG